MGGVVAKCYDCTVLIRIGRILGLAGLVAQVNASSD